MCARAGDCGEVPIRHTSALLIGVIDGGDDGLTQGLSDERSERRSHADKRSGGSAAFVRFVSGRCPCAIEQPRPELRGALVWVPAWNVVRPSGKRRHRDSTASSSSSSSSSCAPLYLEMRGDVVVLQRPAGEGKGAGAPGAVTVADLEKMEGQRRQSASRLDFRSLRCDHGAPPQTSCLSL